MRPRPSPSCASGTRSSSTDGSVAPRGGQGGTAGGGGAGGGLRLAASRRGDEGPVLALNGDELLDVDLAALRAEHERGRPAATLVVAQVHSPFGIVDLGEDGAVTGFREAPRLPHWVNS